MPDVVNNQKDSQFEANGAFLQYRLRPGEIVMIHTEVLPELEGQGLGGQLARAALDYARSEGLKVVPRCAFVSAFIRRHSEYPDLVEESV